MTIDIVLSMLAGIQVSMHIETLSELVITIHVYAHEIMTYLAGFIILLLAGQLNVLFPVRVNISSYTLI